MVSLKYRKAIKSVGKRYGLEIRELKTDKGLRYKIAPEDIRRLKEKDRYRFIRDYLVAVHREDKRKTEERYKTLLNLFHSLSQTTKQVASIIEFLNEKLKYMEKKIEKDRKNSLYNFAYGTALLSIGAVVLGGLVSAFGYETAGEVLKDGGIVSMLVIAVSGIFNIK